MSKRDLSNYDASTHAAAELTNLIRKDRSKKEVRTVSVQKAMAGRRLLKIESDRNVTRVLFVSHNTELLNPDQQSLDGYLDVSGLFAEVHILILREGIKPKQPVLRVSPNVWMYTAAANLWWQTPAAGIELMQNQLEFAAGFRPDLIISLDPFESALTVIKLGKMYQKPTQLHVVENYFDPKFDESEPGNFWRRQLTRFTVEKFASVRTRTETLEKNLHKQFKISNLETLPRFQDYEALISKEEKIDLKAKFKPHIFFMLYIGRLDEDSSLDQVLDAARFALQNPRMALIVLGNGSARSDFERRAKTLGIEAQVIFESKAEDILPYLKSANLLIVSDTDKLSEEMVLRGAAAGIPLIMSETEKRLDVFTDGESAFLCEAGDVQNFSNRINDLLNDLDLRKQFVEAGQSIIREHFHSDPKEYQEAYRNSIEQAFFVDEDVSEGSESVKKSDKKLD